jgi:two-component system, LytTR family, response regulator
LPNDPLYQIIDREVITDLLWPDIDTSKAVQQLYTTIYNIRQTLKNSGMDGVSISSMGAEGGYVLKLGNTLIDKEVWETQLLQSEALDENNISEHEQLLNMYKGDYFGGYGYLWAEYEKERLRRMWLSLARKISSFYIEHDSPDRAIQVNYRIQQCNPLEEESYFTLMKLFDSLGNRTGVREQYKILTSRLEQELGAAPDDQIITWFKQWSRNS